MGFDIDEIYRDAFFSLDTFIKINSKTAEFKIHYGKIHWKLLIEIGLGQQPCICILSKGKPVGSFYSMDEFVGWVRAMRYVANSIDLGEEIVV